MKSVAIFLILAPILITIVLAVFYGYMTIEDWHFWKKRKQKIKEDKHSASGAKGLSNAIKSTFKRNK